MFGRHMSDIYPSWVLTLGAKRRPLQKVMFLRYVKVSSLIAYPPAERLLFWVFSSYFRKMRLLFVYFAVFGFASCLNTKYRYLILVVLVKGPVHSKN